MTSFVRSQVIASLISGLITGCAGQIVTPSPTSTESMLMRFNDCADLRSYVADAYLEMMLQSRYGSYGYWGWAEDAATGEDAGADGPTDWSETNVQEEGVDEPDLVKTDGEFIYVAQRGELTVLRSWPPEASEKLASVPIEDDPFALFLRDGRVAVLSRSWNWDGQDPHGLGDATRVTVIDVSQPDAPVVIRTVDVEGWYVDARRMDADLYLVVSRYAEIPWALFDRVWDPTLGLPEVDWNTPEQERVEATDAARQILRPIVEAALAGTALEDLLPRVVDAGPLGAGTARVLLECSDVYHPAGTSVPTVLAVAHVDLDDGPGGDLGSTGLMADGWTVYSSQEHLYVAQSSWGWWWGWGELDVQTHIHRFALDGPNTEYEASGAVDGWLLNRYSMGEYQGYLRIATTDFGSQGFGQEQEDDPASNVFVLARSGPDLSVVGELRGVAPGEQIYSARFQGDRGFLVTFEQVDPLFTLDLSDPTSPTVVGELEVPGYSAYLHPVGDDHLLAVGMDGTEEGAITGLAVSLFDVGDMAAPALVDRYTLAAGDGWSYSEALWDPHAFTFHRDVLAIPAYAWDDGGGFSGLLLLNVDLADGLSEAGRIEHADLVEDSECLYGGWEDEEPDAYPCDGDYWYAWMRRGLIIEDNVYSVSDYGMKVNSLTTPTTEYARILFWPAS